MIRRWLPRACATRAAVRRAATVVVVALWIERITARLFCSTTRSAAYPWVATARCGQDVLAALADREEDVLAQQAHTAWIAGLRRRDPRLDGGVQSLSHVGVLAQRLHLHPE